MDNRPDLSHDHSQADDRNHTYPFPDVDLVITSAQIDECLAGAPKMGSAEQETLIGRLLPLEAAFYTAAFIIRDEATKRFESFREANAKRTKGKNYQRQKDIASMEQFADFDKGSKLLRVFEEMLTERLGIDCRKKVGSKDGDVIYEIRKGGDIVSCKPPLL